MEAERVIFRPSSCDAALAPPAAMIRRSWPPYLMASSTARRERSRLGVAIAATRAMAQRSSPTWKRSTNLRVNLRDMDVPSNSRTSELLKLAIQGEHRRRGESGEGPIL